MRIDSTPKSGVYAGKNPEEKQTAELNPPALQNSLETHIGSPVLMDAALMEKLRLKPDSISGQPQGGGAQDGLTLNQNLGANGHVQLTAEPSYAVKQEEVFGALQAIRDLDWAILLREHVPGQDFMEIAVGLYQETYDKITSFQEGEGGVKEGTISRALSALDNRFEVLLSNAFRMGSLRYTQTSVGLKASGIEREEGGRLADGFMKDFQKAFRGEGRSIKDSFAEAFKTLHNTNPGLARLFTDK